MIAAMSSSTLEISAIAWSYGSEAGSAARVCGHDHDPER
jgi:hypothetical protein